MAAPAPASGPAAAAGSNPAAVVVGAPKLEQATGDLGTKKVTPMSGKEKARLAAIIVGVALIAFAVISALSAGGVLPAFLGNVANATMIATATAVVGIILSVIYLSTGPKMKSAGGAAAVGGAAPAEAEAAAAKAKEAEAAAAKAKEAEAAAAKAKEAEAAAAKAKEAEAAAAKAKEAEAAAAKAKAAAVGGAAAAPVVGAA